jgi:hypothetical protein
MKRRDFFEKSVIAGGMAAPAAAFSSMNPEPFYGSLPEDE